MSITLDKRPSGMTLVECLVVIGIIGVLCSLLMPAVQAAREAARRSSCAHNLRQVLLAVEAYQAGFQVYPEVWSWPVQGPPHLRVRHFSAFTRILPFLDEPALFAAINFDTPALDPYARYRFSEYVPMENGTVMGVRKSGFLCPSDGGGPSPGWTGGCNYRFNIGGERGLQPGNIQPGVLSFLWTSSAAGVRDGLSQTIAVSEKRRGSVEGPLDLRSALVYTDPVTPDTAEEYYEVCASLPDTSDTHPATGLSWFIGTLGHTTYNHVHGPNSRVPDCAVSVLALPYGLAGARSNHPGGVNAGFADGSVRFVGNSIARSVWKALGTRAGGEIVDADSR